MTMPLGDFVSRTLLALQAVVLALLALLWVPFVFAILFSIVGARDSADAVTVVLITGALVSAFRTMGAFITGGADAVRGLSLDWHMANISALVISLATAIMVRTQWGFTAVRHMPGNMWHMWQFGAAFVVPFAHMYGSVLVCKRRMHAA